MVEEIDELLTVGEVREEWINIEPKNRAIGIQFVSEVVRRKAERVLHR